MPDIKKQNLLRGAFILAFAGLLVKFIGAIFKIPLANLIGPDGMGLFSTSYTIYTFMFIVATAGFPVAVSKMVAESAALGNDRDAKRIFSVAAVILSIIGIAGSAILYLFAQPLAADMLQNSRATLGIMAMSPAVFCVALTSAFRGYFQGYQNMYPTAFSQVIEALCKLIVGYTLAKMFLQKSVELASAGAVFGVSLGTFLSLLTVIIFYKANGKKAVTGVCIRSYKDIAKELISITVPITLGASVSSLTNLIDVGTVMNRLQTITSVTPEFMAQYGSLIEEAKFTGGIYEELANSLYGLYTGYAVPVFNLPFTIVVAISMSIVPAISSALARGNEKAARKTIESVTRFTVLFSLPCSAGLMILSEAVMLLLFDTAHPAKLLSELSLAIVFVALVSVTNSILQSYGRTYIPVINMALGGILKLIINYQLVAIPEINIEGAPFGTLLCYGFIVFANMICIIRITKVKFKLTDLILKPVISTAIMAVAVKTVYDLVIKYGFGEKLGAVAAIAVGVAVYGIVILLVGAIKDDDIRMLPKGDKILKLLGR